MSPSSLPPPPRKLSGSSSASPPSSSLHRFPKINPSSLAYSSDQPTDDDDLNALALLLDHSHLAPLPLSLSHQHQLQHHHQHHHHQSRVYPGSSSTSVSPNPGPARPLSIASISSLSSGSYSSFGSNSTHSRRVSQAYLSPLSPTLSDPSGFNTAGSYFSALNEDDECRTSETTLSVDHDNSIISNDKLHPTATNDAEPSFTSLHSPSATTSSLHSSHSSHPISHDMSLAQSSMPSCNYCSSVRSNSICSSGTAGTSTNTGSTIGQDDPLRTELHRHLRNHRDSVSLEQLYDSSRLAILKEYVPTEVRLRLSYHLDECWFLHISPSGQYMASTGLDHSVLLWQDLMTPEPTVYKTLQFSRTITHVEWSPDSKYLIVNLGFDPNRPVYQSEFNLIDMSTGEITLTRRHRDGPRDVPVNGIGWMTDSKRFITSTSGLIYVWNLQGEVIEEVDIGDNKTVDKLCMIPGRNDAVIVTDSNKLEVHSFENNETRFVDTMTDLPTAITLSPDGAYLSISVKSNMDLCRPAQILLYDFQSLKYIRSLEADSYINEKFVVMPSFTGPHFEIMSAGSENGKLHFWDVETGELIAVLEEHSKHSGWTTFHPKVPGFMASCSDDNHIILWVTKDLGRTLQDEDEKWMENRRVEAAVPRVHIKKGW